MLIYYFAFFLPLSPMLFKSSRLKSYFILLNIFFFTFFIGFRHEVGGDWWPYVFHAKQLVGLNIAEFIAHSSISPQEPLFNFFVFLSIYFGFGIYGSNLIFASVFLYCFHKYLKSLPNYYLAFSISVPILIAIVSMGFVQQSLSLSFMFLAILSLRKNHSFLFIIYFLLAVSCHAAVIPMLILYLAIFKLSSISKLFIPLTLFFLYSFFVLDFQNILRMIHYYIGEGLHQDSAGVFYRVSINIISAVIFLFIVRKRIDNIYDKRIYTILSFLTLVLLVFAFHSSPMADRFNYYLFPLQIYTITNFIALFRTQIARFFLSFITIILYFILFTIWLNFGHYSSNWMPYKMFPFSQRTDSCLFHDRECSPKDRLLGRRAIDINQSTPIDYDKVPCYNCQ